MILIGLMRVVRRRIVTILAGLTALAFAYSVWRGVVDPMGAFYLLPARAWELLTGATVAAATGRSAGPRAASVCGYGGFALLLLGLLGPWGESTPAVPVALGVAGTAAVIWARHSPVNRVLGWRPFVFTGLVSYSWYLWHWPVMSIMRLTAIAEPPVWLMCAAGGVTFLLAILSWRFIEQPFRHTAARPTVTLLRFGAALGVVVIAAQGIKLLHGAPQRFDARVAAVDRTVALGRGDCLQTLAAAAVDTSPSCYHPIPGRPGIALLGDSHAAALGPGLRALAQDADWGFVITAKSSCRPTPGVDVSVPGFPDYGRTCQAFLADAVSRIVNEPSIGTVVITAVLDRQAVPSVDRAAASMAALIDEFRRAGKRVIIAGDVPYFDVQPARVILASAIPVRQVLARLFWQDGPFQAPDGPAPIKPHMPLSGMLPGIAAQTGSTYVDLRQAFCGAAGCRFADDAGLLYADAQHLSVRGSKRAADYLAPTIRAAPAGN